MSASFAPAERQIALKFEKMFCTVLEGEFGTEWDACNKYVLMPQPHAAEPLAGMPAGYTVLQLGGFGAQCMIDVAETFGDAAQHLRDDHGITAVHVPLGAFDSSESNAEVIRDFVRDRADTEKFIVLAHSKGAADLMVALAEYGSELTQIRAVVTVAGAVGGSWLVDRVPGVIGELLEAIGGTSCPRQVAAVATNAVESMRRARRQEFLASHERITTPSFAISAVSTEDTTSKVLQPLWKRLLPYAKEQDSHIMERESVIPGGAFLGRALGDHWAVAFPIIPNPKATQKLRELADKNPYPRAALIEAALRIAIAEIGPL
jgi:pimeloyl-ACP methyl ester carboxylesterase